MTVEINEEDLDPIGRAMMRLGVLAYGLTADREWGAAQVDAGDEAGSARRAYVRAMLSFVEGMTNALKGLLLAAHEQQRVQLTDAEIHMLREVQFELDGKFRARVTRRPLRVKDDVRFTLLLLGRCADQPFHPSFGDDGWRAFLDAVAIRNRVTHPRSRDDLWLTEEDLDRVDRAAKWFEDESARFLQHFKPTHKRTDSGGEDETP
jgi:hypothetical protein